MSIQFFFSLIYLQLNIICFNCLLNILYLISMKVLFKRIELTTTKEIKEADC